MTEPTTPTGRPLTGTAREHLDWCVERAMVYADMGGMTTAWASFGSDVLKHEGTAWIATHEFFGMAMLSGIYTTPAKFRDFASGWSVA